MNMLLLLKKSYQRRYYLYRKIVLFFLRISFLARRSDSLIKINFVRKSKFLCLLYVISSKSASDEENGHYIKKTFSSCSSKFASWVVGDYLLRQRIYGDATESLLLKACDRNCEINANFRLMNYFAQCYGFKSKRHDEYIRRMVGSHTFKFLRYSELAFLFTISKQRKLTEINRRIYRRIAKRSEKDPDPTLYFAHKICQIKKSSELSYVLKDRSKIYSEAIKNRNQIEELFRLHQGKVCVVGNSPCEIGKNKGSIIDSFPLVCRINSYTLDKPEDYGSKVDLWCRVANTEVDNTNLRNQGCVVFCANNFLVKNKEAYRYLLPSHLLGNTFSAIPNHVFIDLIRRLGCIPSTGLALLYWIYKVSGPVPKQNLFGFTHLTQNTEDFRTHYFNDAIPRKHHIHEFESEISIFNEITI